VVAKKVIDQIVYTLGIIADDVRHTVDSLEIAGNVSSGAFLFAYSRLVEEQTVRRGDYGMFITMGPGAGLECCLFRC
jgi:predicted naringenin-chalcone synthase